MPSQRKARIRAKMEKTGMTHQAVIQTTGPLSRDPLPLAPLLEMFHVEPVETEGLPLWPDSLMLRYSAEGIDPENYRVFELLQPYVEHVCRSIERWDLLVDLVRITPSSIVGWDVARTRSHEVLLPLEVYEGAQRLSRGVRIPKPPPVLNELTLAWVDRLDKHLFSRPVGHDAYLSVHDYADLRKIHALTGRFDPCTEIGPMRTGYQGSLYASTADYETRTCPIHIRRKIEPGTMLLAPPGMANEDVARLGPESFLAFPSLAGWCPAE